MTNCCDSKTPDDTRLKRARCPLNAREYRSVGVKTILHQLAEPWNNNLKHQAYFYCTDSNCDVVYFGEDASVILTSALRTKVDIKDNSAERTLCYCFGITHIAAESDTKVKKFVIEMTRQSLCSCETSNPSGRCCLKDFPRQ